MSDRFQEQAAPTGHAVEQGTPTRTVRECWRVLVERRWVAYGSILAVVAVTMILTFFSTPEYTATATLQIDRQGPEILTFKEIVGVDPSYAAYQDFYQTQYQILQSRTVARLAAERLDLAGRPDFAARTPPAGPNTARRLGGLLPQPSKRDPLEPAIVFLEGHLDVSPVRNSQLVLVSFTDRNPDLARDAANALVEAYAEFTYRSKYGTTEIAQEFLIKEVARIQAEIATLQRKLQEYGDEKEILAVSDGTQDISEQALGDLNGGYMQALGRLAIARANYESAIGAPPESLPQALSSSLILNLKQQHAEVERRYSQMSERFKDDWPPLMQLRQELEQAQHRLQLETAGIAAQVRSMAEADYRRARAEVVHLGAQVEGQKDEVQRVHRDAVEFAGLQAEIDTKHKILGDLVARQSETSASGRLKDTQTSNVHIVDRAERPKAPVRPRKLLNLVVALVFGSGLGVGMAFLLDHLDNTIKNEKDIERVAPLAMLGYVPLYRPLRAVGGDAAGVATTAEIDMASHLDARSPFAEAFKNLRTSLLLASPDHPPKRIVVSSCEPQDGKSTVSVNLAIVLTQLGRRVLLVDADLRRPRLHRVLGLPNDVGLSSVLSGNASIIEVLQEGGVAGLDVVASGPVPPNPSELLGSPALDAFIAAVEREHPYDHVIFDSPPLLSVTDPVIIATRMDVTVVVVRAGKTARESLAHALVRLGQARVRLAGAVLNAVSEEAEHYYYGRHRYYTQDGAGRGEAATSVTRPFRRPRRAARRA